MALLGRTYYLLPFFHKAALFCCLRLVIRMPTSFHIPIPKMIVTPWFSSSRLLVIERLKSNGIARPFLWDCRAM